MIPRGRNPCNFALRVSRPADGAFFRDLEISEDLDILWISSVHQELHACQTLPRSYTRWRIQRGRRRSSERSADACPISHGRWHPIKHSGLNPARRNVPVSEREESEVGKREREGKRGQSGCRTGGKVRDDGKPLSLPLSLSLSLFLFPPATTRHPPRTQRGRWVGAIWPTLWCCLARALVLSASPGRAPTAATATLSSSPR